ncbi:MAG: hypothetical protein GXO10_06170 [Crenarchaeota archaeon]|nr:hypothetical protein [Thermoproteota archaeon]
MKILYLNLGGCNGCDIELLAGVVRVVEKIGRELPSPDHGIRSRSYDITIVTGPGTLGNLCRIVRDLERIGGEVDLGHVIVLGSCACGGGIWYDSYMVCGGWDMFLRELISRGFRIRYRSVTYVTGCPVRPEDVEKVLVQLLHSYPNLISSLT